MLNLYAYIRASGNFILSRLCFVHLPRYVRVVHTHKTTPLEIAKEQFATALMIQYCFREEEE